MGDGASVGRLTVSSGLHMDMACMGVYGAVSRGKALYVAASLRLALYLAFRPYSKVDGFVGVRCDCVCECARGNKRIFSWRTEIFW